MGRAFITVMTLGIEMVGDGDNAIEILIKDVAQLGDRICSG